MLQVTIFDYHHCSQRNAALSHITYIWQTDLYDAQTPSATNAIVSLLQLSAMRCGSTIASASVSVKWKNSSPNAASL